MHPLLHRATAFAAEQSRRLLALIKAHPVRAAFVLPALVVLYVLVLIPFTPSVGDLRKAKSIRPPARRREVSRGLGKAS